MTKQSTPTMGDQYSEDELRTMMAVALVDGEALICRLVDTFAERNVKLRPLQVAMTGICIAAWASERSRRPDQDTDVDLMEWTTAVLEVALDTLRAASRFEATDVTDLH